MEIYVKVNEKDGRKYKVLVARRNGHDTYISFDREVIIKVLDLRPSEYEAIVEDTLVAVGV